MTKDLSLFVGNNTIRFTIWLHGVLDKLRSVTADPSSLKSSDTNLFDGNYLQTRAVSVEEMREGTKLQCRLLQFLVLDLKKGSPEFLQVLRSRKPLMSGKSVV